MALSEFPKNLYKRLLRASKVIDRTNSQIAFQSILCGKPSTLYSYELQKNIEIGTSTYSLYDKLVSIMNDGEYSTPIHLYPISFYSIIRNTARLCVKNKKKSIKNKQNKFSIFSNYCQDIVLTKEELLEIVTNFESLAIIAQKQTASQQHANIDPLTQKPYTNTFECDVIDWTKQDSDQDFQAQIVKVLKNKHITNNEQNSSSSASIKINDNIFQNTDAEKAKTTVKTKKSKPVLEYTPKTLQLSNDSPSFWRNSLLFQHPLATMSRFNNTVNNDAFGSINGNGDIEPHVLLGLFAQSTHPKLRLTGKKDDSYRIALVLNGERSLLNLADIVDADRDFNTPIMSTFHGTQNVPKMFLSNNVFIGGDDLSTIEILTNNPYCKGVGIMNNKLFWNPDLSIAERIIESGYGTIDQFRFFKGKMKWNNNLWNNIQDRNLYGLLTTSNNSSGSYNSLAKLLWSYHAEENEEGNMKSLWYELVEHCWKTDTKDVESWMQLFNLMNYNHGNVKEEIYRLMQIHDGKIAEQVNKWEKEELARI